VSGLGNGCEGDDGVGWEDSQEELNWEGCMAMADVWVLDELE
jgi:hypothetical protein